MSAQAFQHAVCTDTRWTSGAVELNAMRVTITTKPTGAMRGMWLLSLQVGQTYNLKDDVSRALILNGYAIEERRSAQRRSVRRPESPGRRRTD